MQIRRLIFLSSEFDYKSRQKSFVDDRRCRHRSSKRSIFNYSSFKLAKCRKIPQKGTPMKFTPLLILISSLLATSLSAEESEFQTTTIDLGVMVGDLEKSIQFYTEAVGFSVVGGFTADSQVVKDSGLGDGEALVIKTLALGKEKGATKIKLMQAKESPRKGSQTYITSQLGFRYLTIHVKNMDVSVTRLKKAGVKILAKGPVALSGGKVYLTVVKDPDGNFVELVGPAGQ